MRRRALVATTAAGLGLALALSLPRGVQDRHEVYLPVVPARVYPTAIPPDSGSCGDSAMSEDCGVEEPPAILRPSAAGPLIDALTVPGALVLPAPGVYHLPVQARVASGVTLNGRDRVTLTGHGLMIEDADGVQLRRLAIARVKGDGLTVTRSQGVELDRLDISRATDGLLDMNGGASVTVVASNFHDNTRGLLCGNWQAPKDGREHLTLINVRFERVRVRTPKAQDCDVVARGLTVVDAVEWPVDARGSSVVVLDGFKWSGAKINAPGWRADGGAIVAIDGEVQ